MRVGRVPAIRSCILVTRAPSPRPGRTGGQCWEFVRAVLVGRDRLGLGRGQDQAGLLGLAVGEEGALGTLGRHAGRGHVADGGAQRARVLRLLHVRAVGATGPAGRDLGHGLDQGAVGADLVPHRDRDRGDQLLLGGVDRAVALPQVLDVLRPLGLVLLGQDAEGAGAQAVLERVHGRARLALGRVGAALLGGGHVSDGGSREGHGGGSGCGELGPS